VRSALIPLAVAPLLVAVLSADGPARRDEASPTSLGHYLVRFENTVRNDSPAVLRDVRCDLLLPETGPGQHVSWVRLSPHGWTLERDAEGQWAAFAESAELRPGEAVTFGWLAEVELFERRADTTSPATPTRGAWVADEPVLEIESPAVVAAAERIRSFADSDAPDDLIAATLSYLAEHVEYELDGGWRPAPDVLREGRGSCSETTFAFVAICRRLGIPARFVGGTLLRGGMPGRAVDASFHRIAEVWLPGRGFTPVETTDSDGRVSSRMLVLSRAGSDRGATGLYYHARNSWRSPSGSDVPCRPRMSKRAFWVDATHSVSPVGDPLVGLRDGDRPSFARCEMLLAETEAFGPPVASGTLGPAPVRDGPPRRSRRETHGRLLDAGHPCALRLGYPLAQRGGSPARLVQRRTRAALEPALAAEYLSVFDDGPAAFEAWWAGASRRVVPVGRGRIGVTKPRPPSDGAGARRTADRRRRRSRAR